MQNYLYPALALVFPIAIVIAYSRRRRQKARYYADPRNEGTVEGSIEDLNREEPDASPWRNDEIARIRETMELVDRFDTMRGYTESLIEEMKIELKNKGIESESVFLEGYPVGAIASLTTRMGIFELYAERSQIRHAREIIQKFLAK